MIGLIFIYTIGVVLGISSFDLVNGTFVGEVTSALGNVAGQVGSAATNAASTTLLGEMAHILDGSSAGGLISSATSTVIDKIGMMSQDLVSNDGSFYNYMYPDNDDYPWSCVCDENDYEKYKQGLISKVRCRNQIDTSLQNAIAFCDPENHHLSSPDNNKNKQNNTNNNNTSLNAVKPHDFHDDGHVVSDNHIEHGEEHGDHGIVGDGHTEEGGVHEEEGEHKAGEAGTEVANAGTGDNGKANAQAGAEAGAAKGNDAGTSVDKGGKDAKA